MSNVKKLILYCIDCVKSSGRSSAFNNLRSNKDNKIYITNENEFNADNKEICEIMTLSVLNKSTMSIIKGGLFLEGIRGHDRFYSPLLYTEAELLREGDKIRLVCDNDGMTVNVGVISNLLENDADMVENTIMQLLEVENPERIDFESVLRGLINLDGLTIKKQNAIILARMPESSAGLISELKKIAEAY